MVARLKARDEARERRTNITHITTPSEPYLTIDPQDERLTSEWPEKLEAA